MFSLPAEHKKDFFTKFIKFYHFTLSDEAKEEILNIIQSMTDTQLDCLAEVTIDFVPETFRKVLDSLYSFFPARIVDALRRQAIRLTTQDMIDSASDSLVKKMVSHPNNNSAHTAQPQNENKKPIEWTEINGEYFQQGITFDGTITEVLVWTYRLDQKKVDLVRRLKVIEEPCMDIWAVVMKEPGMKGLERPGNLEPAYHLLLTMKVENNGETEWVIMEKGHQGMLYTPLCSEAEALNYSDNRASTFYMLHHWKGCILPVRDVLKIAYENSDSTHFKAHMGNIVASQQDSLVALMNRAFLSSCWIPVGMVVQLVDTDFNLAGCFDDEEMEIRYWKKIVHSPPSDNNNAN